VRQFGEELFLFLGLGNYFLGVLTPIVDRDEYLIASERGQRPHNPFSDQLVQKLWVEASDVRHPHTRPRNIGRLSARTFANLDLGLVRLSHD